MSSAPVSVSALLKSRIRTVRDWPKPGVNFRDATTLFHDPEAFRATIDAFAEDCAKQPIDIIAAVDARGFILGGALAYALGKPAQLRETPDDLAAMSADQLRARAIDLLLTREESREAVRRLLLAEAAPAPVVVDGVPEV